MIEPCLAFATQFKTYDCPSRADTRKNLYPRAPPLYPERKRFYKGILQQMIRKGLLSLPGGFEIQENSEEFEEPGEGTEEREKSWPKNDRLILKP